MSLIPYAPLGDFAFSRPSTSTYDQTFGPALMDEFFSPALYSPGYFRPWRFQNLQEHGVSRVINDKDKFEVNLDVKQFKPEELTVKNLDNAITIEGRHEEKQDDHGYIARHFMRRYVMPKDVDVSQIKVQLSPDGILNFSAPKKALPEAAKVGRPIPISICPPPVKPVEAIIIKK